MNFLNNTKLIFKSVLDLVPAVLLAIIVAIIAGYGMNSLNKNFKEINEVQLGSHARSISLSKPIG